MTDAIADTGFVVAVGNQADSYHDACNKVYRGESVIYLPQSVLSEVGYMLKRELGNQGLAMFIRQLPATKYRILALDTADLPRIADLLQQYADSRVDFVDASVVAVAERLNSRRILTLDKRDFQIIRPEHTQYFELHP